MTLKYSLFWTRGVLQSVGSFLELSNAFFLATYSAVGPTTQPIVGVTEQGLSVTDAHKLISSVFIQNAYGNN